MIISFGDGASEVERIVAEYLVGYVCRLEIAGGMPMDIKVLEVWRDTEGYPTMRFDILDKDSAVVSTSNIRLCEEIRLSVY